MTPRLAFTNPAMNRVRDELTAMLAEADRAVFSPQSIDLVTSKWTIVDGEWVRVPSTLTFGPNGMSDRLGHGETP